jgi:hypothetical protein
MRSLKTNVYAEDMTAVAKQAKSHRLLQTDSADILCRVTAFRARVQEPALVAPGAIPSLVEHTSLCLVIRREFLLFSVKKLARVASKTASGSVVVAADTPGFGCRWPGHGI